MQALETGKPWREQRKHTRVETLHGNRRGAKKRSETGTCKRSLLADPGEGNERIAKRRTTKPAKEKGRGEERMHGEASDG